MLYIPNMSPKDETQFYNPHRFRKDSIPFIEFKLSRFTLPKAPFRYFFQLVQFCFNSWRLKRVLKRFQPDGVIIGSHLGGIYIRLIQMLCSEMKIPILSICLTWDIVTSRTINNTPIQRWLPLPKTAKKVLRWQTYNKYMRNHLFLVTGYLMKQHLIRIGVKQEQITVTGNPVHDETYEYLNRRRVISQNIGLKKEKYIVFLTEIIHEIFGIDYLKNLAKILKDILDKLSPDIRVIIKFHPRETPETKNIFRKELCGHRFEYFENIDLISLLYGAQICIGHYTRALEISFIVGTPVLAINFSGNEIYSIYNRDDNIMSANKSENVMVATTSEELEQKLIDFFSDEHFRQKAESVREKWLEDNIYAIDGQNTNRVVDTILAHIDNFRRKR